MKFSSKKALAFSLIYGVTFIFLLAILVVEAKPIRAQSTDVYFATTTNAECSDYYSSNSVGIDIKPNIIHSIAGAEMSFFGDITNKSKYQIVEGKLYAKMFRDRNVSDNNGPDVLDTFVVKDNITLKPGEKLSVNFKWKIPSSALGGEYRLATYFISSNKFNLAGLSFTDTSVGDLSSFTVKGQVTSGVFFKKDGIKVNNQPYFAVNYTPVEPAVGPISIIVPITNTTKERQAVKTEINVYKWDTQSPENKIETITQVAIIEPGKTIYIPFKITDTQSSVYYVEAVLKYKDSKSILGIRFVRDGVNMPKINFPSVVSYPLVSGQKNKIFSCFYNASNNNTPIDAKLRLEILSDDNVSLLSYEYEGKITSGMSAVEQDFTPRGNYKDFKVHATLYSGSKVVDEVYIPYSCASIDPAKCGGSGLSDRISNKWVKLTLEILGILILLLLIILIFVKLDKVKTFLSDFMNKHLRVLLLLLILVASFSAYSNVYAINEDIAECSSGSGSGSGSGMGITNINPASTFPCNSELGVTINKCEISNNVEGVAVSGFNLNKILNADIVTWPITLSDRTETSLKLKFRRLSENEINIVFQYTNAVGGTSKCKKDFDFVCKQPIITNITPTKVYTRGTGGGADPFLTRTITLTGQNFEFVKTIKIANQSVTDFTLVNNTTITFEAPSGAAGWKDVGGTSWCFQKNINPIIHGLEYVKVPKQIGDPIPSFPPNPWIINKMGLGIIPDYDEDILPVKTPGLHYWTYDDTNDVGGVWNFALSSTSANIAYQSTVTDDKGVVLRNGNSVPVGTNLHFIFDEFTNNSRINWNVIGATSNVYGGKWIGDAAYPSSANVCKSTNLFAANTKHADPLTGVVSINVNVYVPLSVAPPNKKLIFGDGNIVNPNLVDLDSYPSWGAPAMKSNDNESWDCSSSADPENPTLCVATSTGTKDIYMYYAPTYGYFYYGFNKAGATCQTNDVALHKKGSVFVNQDPVPLEVGVNTCAVGTFGCTRRFLTEEGNVTGCSEINPYYNKDTNKCYATLESFISSYHIDLSLLAVGGGYNICGDYYSTYQLRFNESVYKLSLNIIPASTSKRPSPPLITGPSTVVVDAENTYYVVSTSTSVIGKKESGGILGLIMSVFKKAFAQTEPEAIMVEYHFDWDNDGETDYLSGYSQYGVLVSGLKTWATTGHKTFSVMAEDPGTSATSSWVTFDVEVVDNIPIVLGAPNLTGSTCDGKLRLSWNAVPSSVGYSLNKNAGTKVGEDLNSSTLSLLLSSVVGEGYDADYHPDDSYYLYAFRLQDVTTSETTTSTSLEWVGTQEQSPQKYWFSITSSADGTKLAAVDFYGFIYTSTTSGATWIPSDGTSGTGKYWASITSSADGTKLAAVTYPGYIYTSTNSGATWVQSGAPSAYWLSITSSTDGTKLAAVVYNGYIYTSTNSGATWVQSSAPSAPWLSITSSADGTKLAAVAYDGHIYTSTNSGSTWTQQTSAGLGYWHIASSADGTKLVAVDASSGYIYTSTNSGATWVQSNSPQNSWYSITSSADGATLAAGSNSGSVYISTNSGLTWQEVSGTSGEGWYSITSSADGTKLAAVDYGGSVWTIKKILTTVYTTTSSTTQEVVSSPSSITVSYSGSPAGTWCNASSTSMTGIMSGATFYSKPSWARASDNKCSFFSKIGPTIIDTNNLSYQGIEVTSCKIDKDSDPTIMTKDGLGVYSFSGGYVSRSIGSHTLKCDTIYTSDSETGATSTLSFSLPAKCSKVPDIKEK